MFELPVDDFVFVLCTLIGGGLLLVTVLVDDVLGGILESFDIDFGGASLMPLVLSFVAMFGVGGLFATQVMDLHGGQAATVGVVSGTGGAAVAFAIFRFLRASVTEDPFAPADLVGGEAYVSVGIPRSGWGSVYVSAEGQTHEFRATSRHHIEPGQRVRISGVAGSGLVVEIVGDARASSAGQGSNVG